MDDLTWPEAGRRADAGAVLLIPLGATEQHGPHLPLSTDTDIAVSLCERIAAGCDDVVIAPPIGYGSSGEHAGFPGTLSIGQDALRLVLIELVRSATTTYDKVAIVSAHGGNAEPLCEAVELLASEGRDVLVLAPAWEGEPHAGRTETAMMLAIAPERVRMEFAEPGATEPLSKILSRLRSQGVRAVSESGVLGDPTGATAAEGEQLLAGFAATMTGQLRAWRSR